MHGIDTSRPAIRLRGAAPRVDPGRADARRGRYARRMGIHAARAILSMGLGLFSPPFGVGYYGACAVSQTHPDEGIRPIIGYMIALFIGIVIVASVPWISIGFL